MLNDKTILVTGGTGSFGKKLTEIILSRYKPHKYIIYSRDELKQYEMKYRFGEEKYRSIRYFIGDVRDRDRLYRAFDGVDIVIHAAALKQVPTAEYNPFEAIKTNVLGAANIIDAAIDRGVGSVIALSTDKAANPINLYGATKLCSDKLFTAANNYVGGHGTRFSVVRYGNVVGSRGSVIPFFLEARKSGVLPITDTRMTRFWITLEQGVEFVLACLDRMKGGEVFIPKIPSMKIIDLAHAVAPDAKLEEIGMRPGEKLHEEMISADDSRRTVILENRYVVTPVVAEWGYHAPKGELMPEGHAYRSDTNDMWMSQADIKNFISRL